MLTFSAQDRPCAATPAMPTRPRRTLYRNGRIYTPSHPCATALAVQDGRVAWIGTEADAVGFCESVPTIDLRGSWVTPAFVDAHVHATATGLALHGLDVSGCRSESELLDALAAHAAAHPGQPILGHGWDETRWPAGHAPRTPQLDACVGETPVYLTRVDAHSAVANSALRAMVPELPALAGYSPQHAVTRDAHHAIRRMALASITPTQRRAAQQATRARAAQQGIAALHECAGPDISSEDDFLALLALAAEEPGPEVFGFWAELGAAAKARELGAVNAGGDLFVDGSLGSHTALLREPYRDLSESHPDRHGTCYADVDAMCDHIVDSAAAALPTGFHVIGDAAIDMALDAFGKAAAVLGAEVVRNAGHRLEHAECLDLTHIKRMVEYGLIASVQPMFDAVWGGRTGMYAQRMGAERAARLNPLAALAAHNVPLAFGSDAPVTPLSPWQAVRAACSPREARHALDPESAFAAHTRGGWRALNLGALDTSRHVRRATALAGILEVGMPATFAVWRHAEWQNNNNPLWTVVLREDPACVLMVTRGDPAYEQGTFLL